MRHRLPMYLLLLFAVTFAGSWPAHAEDPQAARVSEPSVSTVLPGALDVLAYDHVLAVGEEHKPCLTFVTRGFAAHGQAEIQLTLLRGRKDDVKALAQDFHGLVAAIYEYARQGRLVGPGERTELDPGTPLFGRFVGVLYVPAVDNLGIPFQPGTLQALLVREGELESVRKYGVLRVVAQLTAQARFFPWPPWVDRLRKPVRAPAPSLLDNVPRIRLPDGRVTLTTGPAARTLTIHLGPLSRGHLLASREALGDAFALMPAPSAEAAGLVASDRGVVAYLHPGDDIAPVYDHPFVVLGIADHADMVGSDADGLALALNTATAERVWDALERGEDSVIPLAEGHRLVVDVEGAAPDGVEGSAVRPDAGTPGAAP